MPKINGKIYYNNVTGDVLLVINQNEGVWLREKTFAEDVATYPQLKEVNKEVIKLINLEWDQYKEDLAISTPVRVKDGEFLWHPFDETPSSDPQKSLSSQIRDLEKKTDEAIIELSMVIAMGGMY